MTLFYGETADATHLSTRTDGGDRFAFLGLETSQVLVLTTAGGFAPPATIPVRLWLPTPPTANPALPATICLEANSVNLQGDYLAMTPTPVMDVSLRRPGWWTSATDMVARVISPDGTLAPSAATVTSNPLHLRLPPFTNYLSLVSQTAVTPPRLSIINAATAPTLSWTAALSVVLETTTNLTGAATWTCVAGDVVLSNEMGVMPLVFTNSPRQFYRLRAR